ncbi:efflux RND transporter periplasmic adaptor subunit [uncultured Amaricoccus sp.]|uniref:efflux RND transporter periplasmic adaptor subunit n=1 Tax=uncultured Amaricoccus sp. TaxID=339341 RepID=UPI0026206E21|nr:efflux RND transporter periplasmic adaptor subunit [uncultured Amaricoccus sp.]
MLAAAPAAADTLVLAPETLPEWKAVYGRVEARDVVPARARIGGTLVELLVTEGDEVAEGARIATVRDDKIDFQVRALDAQLAALRAQLTRAEAELARGRSLVERGVATPQRLEQLETEVQVTLGQIAATEAERAVVVLQGEEGAVLAPAAGRVLDVPVTHGAVVMPGEPVATIGSGGLFLRLAVPERHAGDLVEGAEIRVTEDGVPATGRLARIYPQIQNGRVVADVEVEGLAGTFVDARVLVSLPVGERRALLVPAAAVVTRSGIDFVRVLEDGTERERAVVTGERVARDDGDRVEILTGLEPGALVVVP